MVGESKQNRIEATQTLSKIPQTNRSFSVPARDLMRIARRCWRI